MRTLLLLLSLACYCHAASFANTFLFRAAARNTNSSALTPFYEFYSDVGVLNGSGSPASDGETVGTLQDQSGNGRHLTQGTDANRPVYTSTGALNGHNPIAFDGIDDILSVSHSSVTAPFTRFVVFRLFSDVSGQAIFGSEAFLLIITSSGVRFRADRGTALNGSTVFTNANIIATCVFNGASGKFRVNGVEEASGNVGANTITQLLLGGIAAGTYPLSGRIYAVVGYDAALDAGQITAEEARLQVKYGL